MLGRLQPVRLALQARSSIWVRTTLQPPSRTVPQRTRKLDTSILQRRQWSSSSRKDAEKPTPPPTPPPKATLGQRLKTAARWTMYIGGSSVAGVLLLGGAIFLHDAFTYTDRHVDRVPVNPLALHPDTGGPKNLPVARVLVEDEEDEENRKLCQKPRLVIVGGGWGVRLSTFPFSDS